MADAELATRAPESDAQEESSSIIAGDSKPDQGAASLGVCSSTCTSHGFRTRLIADTRSTASKIARHVRPASTRMPIEVTIEADQAVIHESQLRANNRPVYDYPFQE
jgi:hypothetical protein